MSDDARGAGIWVEILKIFCAEDYQTDFLIFFEDVKSQNKSSQDK